MEQAPRTRQATPEQICDTARQHGFGEREPYFGILIDALGAAAVRNRNRQPSRPNERAQGPPEYQPQGDDYEEVRLSVNDVVNSQIKQLQDDAMKRGKKLSDGELYAKLARKFHPDTAPEGSPKYVLDGAAMAIVNEKFNQ